MTALLDPDPTGDRPRPAARRHERRRPQRPVGSGCFGGAARPAGARRTRSRAALAGRASTRHRQLSSPASATRSPRPSTARPGWRPIARLLPRPSDDEVVERPRRRARAPSVSWNGPITGHRRFAMTTPAARPDHRDQAAQPARRSTTSSSRSSPARVRDWLDAPRRAAVVADRGAGADARRRRRQRRRPRRRARRPAADQRRRPGRAVAPHERRADDRQAEAQCRAGLADAGRVAVRPAGASPRSPAGSSARCRTAASPAPPSTWRSPTCQAHASRCTSPAGRWRPTTPCSRSTT